MRALVQAAALFFALLLSVGTARAECVGSSPEWSATPDYDSVFECVSAAQDGDTVRIQSGSATWPASLTIAKNIHLIGAGKGSTVITDGVLSESLIAIGDGLDNPLNPRISGMTIIGSVVKSNWTKSAVQVTGKSKDLGFRIDNIHFNNPHSIGVAAWGWTWGVVADCDFDQDLDSSWSILIYHSRWGGEGDFGDKSWSLPDGYGTEKFLFVEDCVFNNKRGDGYIAVYGDSYAGARYVYRYNTFNDGVIKAHGTDSTNRQRGTRVAEIYRNHFRNTLTHFSEGLEWRSGTAVFYENTAEGLPGVSNSGIDNGIVLKLFRHGGNSWWPPCDGTFPLDQNLEDQNGYLCLDQPGAGQSDYISGGSTAAEGWLGIVPYEWPHQVSSPVYIWGNSGFNYGWGYSQDASIQLDRDYFLSEKPGYAAYPYPHPLSMYTATPSCEVGGPDCTGANGRITPNTAQTLLSHLTTTFLIEPDRGYTASVGGTCGGELEGNVYITNPIHSDCTVTASFSPAVYTITPITGLNGSISPGTEQSVSFGGTATFTITPDAGYAVADVLVDGISQGPVTSYTFTNVDADHTISAAFIQTFTITATAGTGGIISPGSASVWLGGSQTFTITPNTGYAVSNVTVDGISQGPVTSYTFTNVDANHTISAAFIRTFTITATAGTGGTISPPSATVPYGGSRTFTIIPDAGYYIQSVYVDNRWIGRVSSYTFTNVRANHTIRATFRARTYTITGRAGTGGTISPTYVRVPYGGSQTFTIRPYSGYYIYNVYVDGQSVGRVSSYTFSNVSANHRITAYFRRTYT